MRTHNKNDYETAILIGCGNKGINKQMIRFFTNIPIL